MKEPDANRDRGGQTGEVTSPGAVPDRNTRNRALQRPEVSRTYDLVVVVFEQGTFESQSNMYDRVDILLDFILRKYEKFLLL